MKALQGLQNAGAELETVIVVKGMLVGSISDAAQMKVMDVDLNGDILKLKVVVSLEDSIAGMSQKLSDVLAVSFVEEKQENDVVTFSADLSNIAVKK